MAGVAALAPALSLLTGLHTLNLAFNDLDEKGAAAIAPALSLLTWLHTLKITYWDRVDAFDN